MLDEPSSIAPQAPEEWAYIQGFAFGRRDAAVDLIDRLKAEVEDVDQFIQAHGLDLADEKAA